MTFFISLKLSISLVMSLNSSEEILLSSIAFVYFSRIEFILLIANNSTAACFSIFLLIILEAFLINAEKTVNPKQIGALIGTNTGTVNAAPVRPSSVNIHPHSNPKRVLSILEYRFFSFSLSCCSFSSFFLYEIIAYSCGLSSLIITSVDT
ncbi:hypothetical protein IIV31_114R [Armadillidium vulgare iridescent virus]|uniref:Uncharacterized protein n=1 Tax=Armadillidium vulgare iridescent virus TaxID=72201 RepID=A0A068QKI9_9VIRU|nr:hypothetical protein IIV31_114R [Armadillidium vulgare iridescent virus]CCV02486.1 hypothetical protein IIV31_114R [Armadillidium vulgare iridescent virus]